MPFVFDDNKAHKKKRYSVDDIPGPLADDKRRATGTLAEDLAFPDTEEAPGIEKVLPGFRADRKRAVRPLQIETLSQNREREENAVGRRMQAQAEGTAQGIASATAAGAREPGLTAQDAEAAHQAGVSPIESAIRQEVERVLAARDRTGQQGAQPTPGTGEAPAARAVLADGTVVERWRQERRTPAAGEAVNPEASADAEKDAHFAAQDKAAADNRRAIIKEMDAEIAAAGEGSEAWDKKRAIRLKYEKRLRGEAPTADAVAQAEQGTRDFLGNIMGPDISPESGLAKAVAADPTMAKYEKQAAYLLKFAMKRNVTPAVAAQADKLRARVAKRIATVSAAHMKAEKVKADAVNLKVRKAKTKEAKDAAIEDRDELAAVYLGQAATALDADNPAEARTLVADALRFYPESSSTKQLLTIQAKAKATTDAAVSKTLAENKARITAEKAAATAEKAAIASKVTELEPDVNLAKEDYNRALVEYDAVLKAIQSIELKPKSERKDFAVQLEELTQEAGILEPEIDRLKAIRDEKVQHIADIKSRGTAFFQEKTAASVPTEPKGPEPPKPKKAGDKLPDDIARQYLLFYRGNKQAARAAARRHGWSF